MNRRRFIQSLAAVFTLPAIPSLPLRASAAVLPAATKVPVKARSWAVYMSTLHGECPPHALQSMLNISAGDAKRYVSQLIAEGVIKPNPLLHRSVSKLIKSNDDGLLDRIKKRLEMKTQSQADEPQILEDCDSPDCTNHDASPLEEFPDAGLEAINEDTTQEPTADENEAAAVGTQSHETHSL